MEGTVRKNTANIWHKQLFIFSVGIIFLNDEDSLKLAFLDEKDNFLKIKKKI